MAQVKYTNVQKFFGNLQVLKNVNFTIEDKKFVVLLGPSGCGKTTLLRMTAGLEDIVEGEILLDDKVMNQIHPRDRDIAMVFQNYALYPQMNVFDNIAFSLQIRKISKDEIVKKVNWAAEILNLKEYLKRLPKELSGGQRQRVAMGRALVRDPKVFLFDEPLSNLDAKLRSHMRYEIRKLHNDLQTTTIYVTHDQIEAMTMADKIVVMQEGYIEQVGSPLELYDSPANTFVGSFIGSPAMNMIEGVVDKDADGLILKAGDSYLPLPKLSELQIGQKIIAGIRPENLVPSKEGIAAKIAVIEPTGSETHLLLRGNNQDLTCVLRERTYFKPGQEITLTSNINQIHIFDHESKIRIN
mgnify:CR=1 FL=1